MMADKKKELREKLEKIIESGDEERIELMDRLMDILLIPKSSAGG